MKIQKKTPVFLVCCCLLVFIACSHTPRQEQVPPESDQSETLTVLSRAERDPYSESLAGKALPEKVELFYFYEQSCESCNELSKFYKILSENLPIPLDVIRINTMSGNNNKRTMAFFDHYQVPDDERQVPIVFLGGGYLSGIEAISNELIIQLSIPQSAGKLAEFIQISKGSKQ